MQIFHPGIQGRNAEYFNLGHIAGETRYADIGDQDVEVASVVSDVEHGSILGDILRSPDTDICAGKKKAHAEGPFHNGKGASGFEIPVVFSDDPLSNQKRNAAYKKEYHKKCD